MSLGWIVIFKQEVTNEQIAQFCQELNTSFPSLESHLHNHLKSAYFHAGSDTENDSLKFILDQSLLIMSVAQNQQVYPIK